MTEDAGSETRAPRHPHAIRVGVLVALVGVALDQVTKELAERLLVPGQFVPWLGERVGWHLVYNPGGAFGLPAPPWVFLIVTLAVVVIVARVLPRAPTLVHAVALGLLLAGALGNLVDRLLRPGDPGFLGGHVVDFIAWGWWPRFNVADSAITVGVVLLFVALLWEERGARQAEAGDLDAMEGEADAGGEPPADGPSDGHPADGPSGDAPPDDEASDDTPPEGPPGDDGPQRS